MQTIGRFVAETNGILNIQDYGSGNWYNNIRLTGHTGGVILFQNNDAKFQTQSDGVRVEDGGHLYFIMTQKTQVLTYETQTLLIIQILLSTLAKVDQVTLDGM